MDQLLQPETTAAVIMGASNWDATGLPATPSFRRSARAVQRLFIDTKARGSLGLDPELVLNYFDDPAPATDQLARLRETLDDLLREREDLGRPVVDLIFYYIGHGITDSHSNLGLLVRASRKGMENETALRAPDLARVLRISAPKQRRFVILDCCFSEAAVRAFVGMSGGLASAVAAGAAKDIGRELPTRGGLLLCSAPSGEAAIGAPDADATLFTGAVLNVLQEGVPGAGEHLTFGDLNEAVFDRMVQSFGRNAPRPVLHPVNQTQGDLSRLPAFRNQAVDDGTFARAMATAFQVTGNHDALHRLLIQCVSRNEAWAKARLGDLYRNGHCGFRQDLAEAVKWYRAAADQGDQVGQAFYGMFLADGGPGVEQDEVEALRYLRMSAAQGNPDAMHVLSLFYGNGRAGLTPSPEESLRWMQLSAEGGSAVGMAYFAGFLAQGIGVPQDRAKAEELLRKSIAAGFSKAQVLLDQLLDGTL